MKELNTNREFIKKLTMVSILTAIAVVLGLIKIPIMGVTITLVLPVIVIGAALYGPYVSAWLTVIPNLITLLSGEAALFTNYNPFGGIVTMLLKGLLAGYLCGLVYNLMKEKNQYKAVTVAAIVAPTVNSAIFVLGCLIFIWDELIRVAGENGVGIGVLMLGLVVINYVIELVINIVLCPSILRIIHMAEKSKLFEK